MSFRNVAYTLKSQADTKFEFGLDEETDEIYLVDEVLTCVPSASSLPFGGKIIVIDMISVLTHPDSGARRITKVCSSLETVHCRTFALTICSWPRAGLLYVFFFWVAYIAR